MSGQRVMEKLDRGVVAVKAANGNFVSWRVLGEESADVKYNLYRDGSLVNSQPLTVSNYTDASGSTTSKYTVKTVIDGVEKETSKTGINFGKEYLEIKIAPYPRMLTAATSRPNTSPMMPPLPTSTVTAKWKYCSSCAITHSTTTATR